MLESFRLDENTDRSIEAKYRHRVFKEVSTLEKYRRWKSIDAGKVSNKKYRYFSVSITLKKIFKYIFFKIYFKSNKLQ